MCAICRQESPYPIAVSQSIGHLAAQQDVYGWTVSEDETMLAVVLCDGAGTPAEGGALAASAVNLFLDFWEAPCWTAQLPQQLRDALDTVNAILTGENEMRGRSATTALTGFVLRERQLYWAHIGESRLYLLRDGELVQITEDGTADTAALRRKLRGEFPAVDAEAPLCALGTHNLCGAETAHDPFSLRAGDALLLCSDGVWRALTDSEILAALQETPAAAVAQLQEKIVQAGLPGQDNATVLLMQLPSD